MHLNRLSPFIALGLVLVAGLWAWQYGKQRDHSKSDDSSVAPGQWAIPDLLLDYEITRHADPEHVMALLEITPGSEVADIGAGLGFYTRRLAQAVGKEGTVTATETDPFLLSLMLARNETLFPEVGALNNIVPRWVSTQDIGLEENSLDLAFLGHLGCYLSPGPATSEKEFLQSLYRVVRPGGRVAVLQWLYYLWGSEDPSVGTSSPEAIRDAIVANYIAAGFELGSVEILPMPAIVAGYKAAQYHTMEETFTSTLILLRKPK